MPNITLVIRQAQSSDVTRLHNWIDKWAADPSCRIFAKGTRELYIIPSDSESLSLEYNQLPREIQWAWGEVEFTSEGPSFQAHEVCYQLIQSGGNA